MMETKNNPLGQIQGSSLPDYVESLYEALQDDSNKTVPRYGFQVGYLNLLISAGVRSELVKKTAIYPLPNTVDWFQGLINLRGNLIPVFDIYQILNIEQDKRSQNHLLILDVDQQAVAVSLRQSPTILHDIRPLPTMPAVPEALKAYVSHAFSGDYTTWLEFDHSAFFSQLAQDMTRVIVQSAPSGYTGLTSSDI